MTLEEFNRFVESFKKNAGEYTQEELLRIGNEHKNLRPNEKSWKRLAKQVGYPGSGEAYRGFVNYYSKKNLVIKAAEQIFDREEYEKDYKESTRARDIYNAYRASLRNEARTEEFMEAVLKSIDNLPKFKPVIIPEMISSGIEAVLMLSDLHIGVICNNFYNKYNKDIARLRLKKLSQDVVRYCKLHKVEKLNVCQLGDCIHGLIHVSARIEQEMNTVDQIITAAELISEFLNDIKEAAPEIIYRSCTDNHSRAVANKSENIEEDSFGKLIDVYIEQRLKGSNIRFINDNIDDSIGKFTLMNGKTVMFAHGHNDSINRTFENFVGATREFVDYALIGHYHCAKSKEFQGFNIIVNGSVVGTDQFALSKRLFSDPSQTLLVFDDQNLINYKIDLKVE